MNNFLDLYFHRMGYNSLLDNSELNGSLSFDTRFLKGSVGAKKPSMTKLQELNLQKDIETSRWLNQNQNEINSQKNLKQILEICKEQGFGVIKFEYKDGNLSFECGNPAIKQPSNISLNLRDESKQPQSRQKQPYISTMMRD